MRFTVRCERYLLARSGCSAFTGRAAPGWTARAAAIKGIAGTSSEAEEALTGPWAVLAALNRYVATLRRIERFGAPQLERRALRHRDGGQTVVEVFPQGLRDRMLLPGGRAEVWMGPDHPGALDAAIASLRYGFVGINAWSDVGFSLPQLPWGADRKPRGSGCGVVHNSLLLAGTQKAVLYAPFSPFPKPP